MPTLYGGPQATRGRARGRRSFASSELGLLGPSGKNECSCRAAPPMAGIKLRYWSATDEDDFPDCRDWEEDIAKFPYVEFTGQDGITCPTCQGIGYIPPDQVNELVALIPYHDQRLKPRRTKFYVLVSVLLCLLASGLVVFFLFPHSVHVEDDGVQVVKVWLDQKNSLILLTITVTLRIRNSNFYSVTVTSLSSQVQYMNSVVGTQQMVNVTRIQPLSEKLVNFTVKSKMGGPSYYAYFFCTLSRIRVHNIVILMRTSVKISYLCHVTQSSLETHHYVDCGVNSTAASGPDPTLPTPEDVAQSALVSKAVRPKGREKSSDAKRLEGGTGLVQHHCQYIHELVQVLKDRGEGAWGQGGKGDVAWVGLGLLPTSSAPLRGEGVRGGVVLLLGHRRNVLLQLLAASLNGLKGSGRFEEQGDRERRPGAFGNHVPVNWEEGKTVLGPDPSRQAWGVTLLLQTPEVMIQGSLARNPNANRECGSP
ncbi:transmembrane protein 106C [Sphaerodactylus townsendi]|uniref:transmembrane protein 106C n=1 Tax=Sphaerodactylus townsendi TaxID=933632 RepID=UPI002026E528|nr:transmembrane protein 106C [Sphaerodactylus townsendi]